MESKSLGVIGGMGPKATAVFFDKVVEMTVAAKDQDHIDMVILNHATIPDRTNTIFNKKAGDFLSAIEKDIRLLEVAGVANIAIPCNTSHYFFKDLVKMTDINIINMIEETTKRIFEKYGKGSKVGILATQGTLSSGIYEEACNKYGLDLFVPEDAIRERTMKIIYDNVKGGLNTDSSEIEAIIKELITREKCKCIIIACTELSCIKLSQEVADCCIDAMAVLVERAIVLSGKQIKGKID